MNLENMLSKRGSHKGYILYDSVYMKCPEEGEEEMIADGYSILFGVMRTFQNHIVVMAVQLCEYTKNH